MHRLSGSIVAVVLCLHAASPAAVRGNLSPGRSLAMFPPGLRALPVAVQIRMPVCRLRSWRGLAHGESRNPCQTQNQPQNGFTKHYFSLFLLLTILFRSSIVHYQQQEGTREEDFLWIVNAGGHFRAMSPTGVARRGSWGIDAPGLEKGDVKLGDTLIVDGYPAKAKK
jgi:hypothetical protein